MRKTQKKFLGCFGLVAVVAMTVVAASIPIPGALATTTVSDTIEVRVIGNTPAVELSSSVDNKNVSFPTFAVDVSYENTSRIMLYQTYIGSDGVAETPIQIAVYDGLNYVAGKITGAEFTVSKYGKYIISAEALGADGALTAPEDYIVFQYLPVVASLGVNPVTGKFEVTVDSYDSDVEEIGFYLNNNLIGKHGKDSFEEILSFSLAGQPSGNYTLMVVAKDAAGKTIYIPFTIEFKYDASGVPDAGTPDTGGLFENSSVSKEDFLISGLILFFVISVVAFGVVARNRKPNSRKRR